MDDTQNKLEEARSKIQLAYERALKAESSAAKYNIVEAIEYWKKIFGGYFPSYG